MKSAVYYPTTLLATLLILAGCGSPPSSNNQGTSSEEALEALEKDSSLNPVMEIVPIEDRDIGDHLILSLDHEPPLLNPLLDIGDANGRFICKHILENLVDIDAETLEVVGLLAKSWDISEDHLTYTFHLHPEAKFSDGHPVTAEDVKFSWDLIANPANDTASLRSFLQDIETVTAVDHHTVEFKMSKPYYEHLAAFTDFAVFPKHLYDGQDFNKHSLNRAPVGSGPYVFERWDTGQQIVLARNENYWGDKQPIEKRIWKIITDNNAALQAHVRGDTDYLEMKPDAWHRNASTPEFKGQFHLFTPDSHVPGFLGHYNYIGWNTRKPQFSDKRVRQALCMLFDRDLIIETVWGGLGRKIVGGTYFRLPEYNSNLTPLSFDPEAAAKLLDEAGWKDTDQDGIRDKDGVKFSFELGFGSGVPEYERLGTVYQEELKRAGIEVILAPLEWASFIARVQDRTFDACMLAWLQTPSADPYQLWHSSQAEKGSNYPGFINAENDKLLDDARLEFDREKRIKMYHRQQEIIHDEQPYLHLYSRPATIAISNRFRGIVNNPGGFDTFQWYVPKELQKYGSNAQ